MQHRDRVVCQRIGSFCPDIDCICYSRQQVSAERLVIITHAITERVLPDLSIDRFCNPLRAFPCAIGKYLWQSKIEHNYTDCLLPLGDQINWLAIDLNSFDCPFFHSRGVNSPGSELKDSIIYAIKVDDDYAMFAEARLMTPRCSFSDRLFLTVLSRWTPTLLTSMLKSCSYLADLEDNFFFS